MLSIGVSQHLLPTLRAHLPRTGTQGKELHTLTHFPFQSVPTITVLCLFDWYTNLCEFECIQPTGFDVHRQERVRESLLEELTTTRQVTSPHSCSERIE